MTLTTAVRRSVLAGGLALTILAGPFVIGSAAPPALAQPATQCPPGELEDLFTDECVPEMTPTTPAGNWGQPHQVPMPGQPGVPCTGENTAECVPGGEANTGTSIWVPQATPTASP
jgi:hypothetical protein